MSHSEDINEVALALSAAQGEFKAVEKNKKAEAGKYSYKYADIADVLSMVLPILSKHKLALTQATAVDQGAVFLRTRLIHESGQWLESEYPVCAIQGSDHQKMGAALTYARRYAVSSLLGIASEEDTDARGAEDPAGRNVRRQQLEQKQPARQQTASTSAPTPGDKGVKAALLHAISLAETEVDLNDWYKDTQTNEALEGIDATSKEEVRRAWAAKRKELRATGADSQVAA